jgi:hypothetical protein
MARDLSNIVSGLSNLTQGTTFSVSSHISWIVRNLTPHENYHIAIRTRLVNLIEQSKLECHVMRCVKNQTIIKPAPILSTKQEPKNESRRKKQQQRLLRQKNVN